MIIGKYKAVIRKDYVGVRCYPPKGNPKGILVATFHTGVVPESIAMARFFSKRANEEVKKLQSAQKGS